jgi:tyrosinase
MFGQHGNINFLVWHRQFIIDYEAALRSINPSIVMPYWDWGLDSQAPSNSQVIRDFGGLGMPGTGCISAPFDGWGRSEPAQPCIKRDSGPISDSRWTTLEAMSPIFADSRFESFSRRIEQAGHAGVHVAIGGDMRDTNVSPFDPLFFLHHANVDRFFWIWQLKNPGSQFSGNGNAQMQPSGRQANQIWNLEGECYEYSKGVTAARTNALKRDSLPATCTSKMNHIDMLPLDYVNRMGWNVIDVQNLYARINAEIDLYNNQTAYEAPAVLFKCARGKVKPCIEGWEKKLNWKSYI